MKTFTLLACAALAALPAFGHPQTQKLQGAAPTQTQNTLQRAGHAVRHGSGITLRKAPVKRAAATETASEDLITAPQGTVHTDLVRSSLSFDVEFGSAYIDEVDCMTGEFVESKEGYLYVKNPFAFCPTDTYMKLKIEGETAVLEGPQLIYRDDVYGTGEMEDLYVRRVKYYYDEEKDKEWYAPDEGVIVFDYRNGELSQRFEQDVMYGLTTSDGEWLGFGDWNLTLKPLADKKVVMPANAEAKDCTFSYFMGAQMVKVAVTDKEVFITGINPDEPEVCVKGTLQDGKVTFLGGQYTGVYNHQIDAYTTLQYHTYFMPAIVVQEWWEDWQKYVDVYELTDKIEFDYDASTGVLKSDGVILLNASNTKTYYVNVHHEPKFVPYSGKKPAVPATPLVTEYLPIKDHYNDGDVYGAISFVCLPYDVDGNYIDVHDLYYNMIVNDEVFTFTPEEYANITEPVTDMPYDFTDDFDIQLNDIYHNIYFFNPEYEKIGVQLKYTVDGVTNVSAVAYFGDEPTDGIAQTMSEAEVVSEVYTDLTGRRVLRPDRGIYIKTVTYTDGRVVSTKLLK